MAADGDVLIVGAGVIGCAVARELARRGRRVRLFDARNVAAGATYASAGVLAPYIEAHERGTLFDLTIRSLALYDAWIDQIRSEAGIGIEYRRCGTLEVAADESSAARLRLSASGSDIEWLDRDAARSIEPVLPESIHGALHVATHGYVAVPGLTEALAWASLRHGVEIETHRRIVSIACAGDRVTVGADDGAKWVGGTVVIAAGSWSGQIDVRGEPGVPAGGRPAARVTPIRGQLLRLHWQGTPPAHVLWGSSCYVVPWLDGTVLVGATVEDVGFDERATAAGVRDLLDAVCEMVPEAWRATFLEARVGLRPATPDGLPIIGAAADTPHLVYATGHYRNGILLAPLTAAIVADYVVDGRADAAADAVSPARFVRG